MGDDVAFNPGTTTFIKQRRCVRASQGKLRFVEIRGLSYDARRAADDVPQADADPSVRMWTLVDPDGAEPWKIEYEAPFDEIWERRSYTEAGLPPRKVPHVAFVNPDDFGVVYFLHGSKLFGLDVCKRQLVGCEEVGDGEPIFQRPRVDAWKMSPPTTPMQHQFPGGTHLRLMVAEFDGPNRFVEAMDNGRDVALSARGRMPHSAWIVDYVERQGRIWMTLQNSAYGRYLAREEDMEPMAAVIVDYDDPTQEELLWELVMETGIGGKGFLLNCRHEVWNVSPEPFRVKAILATPEPPRVLPPPPNDEAYLRYIVHSRANDAGDINNHCQDSTHFYGCSVAKLWTVVMQLQKLWFDTQTGLPPHEMWTGFGLSPPDSKDIMCVRPGLCGRLTPLVTDLPRSQESMDIVVLANGSSLISCC